MLKYVVTGTARSGTKYAATLLSNAGLECGHESVFNSWGSNFTRAPRWEDQSHYLGDSSFIVAPFIPEVKDRLRVVHLVRPPLDVIRSIVGIAHVGNNQAPWVQFLDAHINLTQFPPGPQRAAAYWVRWNRLIRDGQPDLTWNVTDITSDDVMELAICAGIEADPSKVVNAVEETNRSINHRQRAEWVNLEHLGRLKGEVVALAVELGVPLESLDVQGAEPVGYVSDEIHDWANVEMPSGRIVTVVDDGQVDGGVATDGASAILTRSTSADILVSHIGAGWYELIRDNEVVDKVRGKEAAEARRVELVRGTNEETIV